MHTFDFVVSSPLRAEAREAYNRSFRNSAQDSTIHEALEERGAKYAIRIPANDCLTRDI